MMNPHFYWSVRRELWENRSVWIAPLAVGIVALLGAVADAAFRLRSAAGPVSSRPYGAVAAAVMLTGFIAGAFYCLDALHGERRDRAILFWKSLPVSDRTAVLSKAAVPLVVQPLLSFALGFAAQLLLIVLGMFILAVSGSGVEAIRAHLPFPAMWITMFYGLVAHTLWYAPIYAWLLLVSAWARRVPALWALLPFVAAVVVERAVLGTTLIGSMVAYRFRGAMQEAFTSDAATTPITRLSQLDPIGFLTTPGLWSGLAFAAVCLVVAVRIRRKQEPI